MKAILEYDVPEDEVELLAAVRAMDMISSIRDFYERLRVLKKHGHGFDSADSLLESLYADYCEHMQEWIS